MDFSNDLMWGKKDNESKRKGNLGAGKIVLKSKAYREPVS